jgi:hypothetical protein
VTVSVTEAEAEEVGSADAPGVTVEVVEVTVATGVGFCP